MKVSKSLAPDSGLTQREFVRLDLACAAISLAACGYSWRRPADDFTGRARDDASRIYPELPLNSLGRNKSSTRKFSMTSFIVKCEYSPRPTAYRCETLEDR